MNRCFDNHIQKYVPNIICTNYFNALKNKGENCDFCKQNYAFVDYFRTGQFNFTTCTNCKFDNGNAIWSNKKRINVLPKNHILYKDRCVIKK